MPISKTKWFEFFLFKGGEKLIGVVGVCLLISSLLGALTPLKITELAKSYDDTVAFQKSLKFLGFLFIGIYFNRALYQLFVNRYILLLMQNVRLACYQKWLHAYDMQTNKDGRSERYPQGEVVSRIMNDTESLRELMTSGTFGIFIDIFFVVSCLGSFIFLNKTLGFFLAFVEVVAMILLVWGSRYMREIFLEVRKSRGMMSRVIADLGGGFKQSYYTRHENYASQRGASVFDDFLIKILRSNIWDAGYYSLAESLYPVLLALVVLMAPHSGITQAAMIFGVVDLIQRSINPVKDVSAKIANIQRAYSGIWRIQEFLGDLEELPSSEGHQYQASDQFHTLEIDIKLFSYPKRNFKKEGQAFHSFELRDIHFKARKGELLGIVGLSGCGKSTLLNIIAANIIPTEGGLLLIREEKDQQGIAFPGNSFKDIVKYREQVSLVSQESHLFSESLAFNISLTPKRVEGLKDFWDWVKQQIPYLEHWGVELEGQIDPRELSLGQRQLLAAIRSCFLRRPVVLFDEISSGLDCELEEALRKMVLIIQQNSLTVIVAHRLETVMGANNILVMHNGRVVDSGHHYSLLEESQVYRQFLKELSPSYPL